MPIGEQTPQTIDWSAIDQKTGLIVNALLQTVEAEIPAHARAYVFGRIAEAILRECQCELVENKLFLDEQLKVLLDKQARQTDKKPKV
jgi:hypothetical protein